MTKLTPSTTTLNNKTIKEITINNKTVKSIETDTAILYQGTKDITSLTARSVNKGSVAKPKRHLIVDILPNDATGTISAHCTSSNNSYDLSGTLTNGSADLYQSNMTSKEYTVVISYSGDSNYNPYTITQNILLGDGTAIY